MTQLLLSAWIKGKKLIKTEVSKKESPCEIAQKLTHGERQDAYGHPYFDFSDVANIWSVLLGVSIRPEQVGLCMIALKLVREKHKHKEDNIIDIAGYANTVQMVVDKKEEIENAHAISGSKL